MAYINVGKITEELNDLETFVETAVEDKVSKGHEVIEFQAPDPNNIVIVGPDKEAVGQLAAEIRKVRPPEPYKGKGIKYLDERIIRKEGKMGKK